jgi:solute carrier family 25 phosphate transporter 23/24/25/41
VADLLNRADVDRTGTLSLDEFRSVFAVGRLRTVFDVIDSDHNGCITPTELSNALSEFGSASSATATATLHRGNGDGATLVKQIDSNNDNCVDFAEFCDAFRFVPFASLDAVASAWQSLPDLDCGTDIVPPLPQKGVPPVFGIIGGVAGVVSKTTTAPLERVKLVAQTSVSPVSIAKELAETRKRHGLKGVCASMQRV